MDDHGCSEANPCRNAALRWVHTSYCQILTLSADRKALREHVREIEDQRRALGDIAMQTKAQWDSQIAMTVARLGGEVEGAPTHAGNFLQRVDELREIEAALREIAGRRCSRSEWEEDVLREVRGIALRALDPLAPIPCPNGYLGCKCQAPMDAPPPHDGERSERREGEPATQPEGACDWCWGYGGYCYPCSKCGKASVAPATADAPPAAPKEEAP